MAQLPEPGSDEGVWGNILNEYLLTSHKQDGTLKDSSVSTASLANNSVTISKIAVSNSPTTGQTLSYNGTGLAWSTPTSSGPVPDATTGAKGIVQLAGDLAGTSAAPTVPGLAAKANTSDVVTLTGTQTVSGNKNFTGTLQSAGAAVVITSDARLTNERTPSNTSVTTAKVADDAITEPKLAVSNTPATNQVLSWNGTGLAWAPPATGGVGDPSVGGDLSGTASNAQIVANAVGATEIASNAVTTAKVVDDAITEPKLAVSNTPATNQVLSWNGTGLAWAPPATGGVGDPSMGGDLSGTASNAQIVANAVGSTEIAADAVTTAKILDGNVTTGKLANTSVTGAKISDNTVTEPKLAISNTPSANQVLSWNGTELVWITPVVGGGSQMSAVQVSDTYTAGNNEFIVCDTSTSGFTITLPAPTNGAFVSVKKKTNNPNAVLVAPPSGSIDAGINTSVTISVNGYGMVVDFRADGTTWHQVG